MAVSEEFREKLRVVMDRETGKVVAARAKVNRDTLYEVLKGIAAPITMRRLEPVVNSLFAPTTPTTPTNNSHNLISAARKL